MNKRALVAYVHDLFMTAFSFLIALYLRLGNEFFEHTGNHFWLGVCLVVFIGANVYWMTGLYRGVWRYASVHDLLAVTKAVSLTILIFTLLMFLSTRLETLPRSLPLVHWLVLMLFLGAPRLLYRIYRDRTFNIQDAPGGRRRIPVLLAGAGDGAELFLRALSQSRVAEYQVVGILTEKPQRVGQMIHGIPIIDVVDKFPKAVSRLSGYSQKPQRLILTKSSFDGATIRHLLDQCTDLGVKMGRIPKLTDFRSENLDNVTVRPIDVEDLLGRPQASLNKDAMRGLVKGRRILITGAGGSIGSELVRQISVFEPEEVGMLELSEYSLYLIEQEMTGRCPELKFRTIIGDVRSAFRIDQLVSEFRPDIVFHAAALKHVPLVENNCCEGITTNVMGTKNVADACVHHGVEAMVMISTDKAINPTNVMGASKRIAEQYCQALDIDRGERDGTNFVTVRFGNVLGSTGSVVPLFQKQLESGGPLTVTHPDMTRYFMTVREAIQLVLLSTAYAKPGSKQDGKIFVLDMGEPVRIVDLAEQMIRLAGFEPGKDIEIEITGCRPGEKLYEELFHESEEIVETELRGVLLAAPRVIPLEKIKVSLEKLSSICDKGDEAGARQMLAELVPGSIIER